MNDTIIIIEDENEFDDALPETKPQPSPLVVDKPKTEYENVPKRKTIHPFTNWLKVNLVPRVRSYRKGEQRAIMQTVMRRVHYLNDGITTSCGQPIGVPIHGILLTSDPLMVSCVWCKRRMR